MTPLRRTNGKTLACAWRAHQVGPTPCDVPVRFLRPSLGYLSGIRLKRIPRHKYARLGDYVD